jgi:toxin ParE1/3/4
MRAAEDQLARILLESARRHGPEAANRYSHLLLAAMAAVGDDPGRLGASDVPRQPGIRAFAARLIRLRMEPTRRVRSPRHPIVYRAANDGIVDILGVVHDRMVLSGAARKVAGAAEAP